MTVYLDVIFIENMVINYIIIYTTGIISRVKIKQRRIILGSVIGAVYSLMYYLMNLKIYSSVILKIFLSVIIIYVSFNSNSFKNLIKQIVLFYLISFVFGGSAIAIIYMVNSENINIQNGILIGTYTIKTVLIGVVIAYFIVLIGFKFVKNKMTKKDFLCEIELKINGKTVKTDAMIDTGNLLKEPISNLPVIIMEHNLFYGIIPKEILNNLEEILGGNLTKIPNDILNEYIPKFKVIPFSSLGKQNGMLLGIKAEKIKLKKEEEEINIDKAIIGIYNKSLTKKGEYKSLVGIGIN